MYLKTHNILLSENPSKEEITSFLSQHKKIILSDSKKIFHEFGDFDDKYLELQKSGEVCKLISYAPGERLESNVDINYAAQIAIHYANNDIRWKELSRWDEKDSSIFELLHGFHNIVFKPSLPGLFLKSMKLMVSLPVILLALYLSCPSHEKFLNHISAIDKQPVSSSDTFSKVIAQEIAKEFGNSIYMRKEHIFYVLYVPNKKVLREFGLESDMPRLLGVAGIFFEFN